MSDASSSNSTSLSTDAPPVDPAMLQAAALLAYMQTKITSLCVVLLVTYSVLCLLCLCMIAYLRRNRSVALRGDSNAARKVLLPAFEPLLWILGGTTGGYSIYFAASLIVNFYPPEIPSIPSESFYAGRQFVLLLVVIFMLQKSVTLPALRRALGVTFGLSVYTIPVAWYIVRHNESEKADFNFWLLTIAHALIFPIFVYVFIWPPGRSSKMALRLYCGFAISQHVLEHSYTIAFKLLHIQLAFNLAYTQLAIGCMCP
ncbi:Tkl/drk protein kinase, partial [Globisporangium polare]